MFAGTFLPGLALASIISSTLLFGASEPPLSVTFREEVAGPAQSGAKQVLVTQFENRSAKVIAAYVILIEHREPGLDKPAAFEAVSTMTRALGFSKGRPGYLPGEQWADLIPVKAASSDPTVSLDLVVFEDGTHWGPDRSKRLDRLLGIRAGATIESKR